MSIQKLLILVLAGLLLSACEYIVLPEDISAPVSTASKGWSAVVTNVSNSVTGDLRIDLTIRNETGNWSAMQAIANKPAVLTSGGKTVNCDTVFVGTGGHRLAPGFQMRGLTAGTKVVHQTQLIYVECKSAEAAPGSRLSIEYSYVTGEYYYYVPSTPVNGKLEVNLDQVVKDLTYPLAELDSGVVQKSTTKIKAINDCDFALADVKRTDRSMRFSWQTFNPGEYPTYVHIGNPPVIGADGIIYGLYESPHLASAPITGAGKMAEWTTDVDVPVDVKGLYILLSVESKQQRLFTNYAIDITDQ